MRRKSGRGRRRSVAAGRNEDCWGCWRGNSSEEEEEEEEEEILELGKEFEAVRASEWEKDAPDFLYDSRIQKAVRPERSEEEEEVTLGDMAVKSTAFSCVTSFLNPFRAAQQLTAENSGDPASPKTQDCKEGQEDSSTSAALVEHQRKQQQQQRVFAVSPPVSPFTASVVKETTSGRIDPASFLIERLEKGWFEENVVGISGWWDVCGTLSWAGRGGRGQDWQQVQPTTSDLMAWVPTNHSDSELFLGPPTRIQTPNLGSGSSQLHQFPTIELATTYANYLSTARDPAGLPGSRLRKLPRVSSDNKISLSDGEQRPRPRSFRNQSNSLLEAVQPFNGKKSKIHISSKKDKPVGKLELGSSDREWSTHSRIETIRDSTKMEKPAGKLEIGSSDKDRRRVKKHESSSMPGAPTRRRREGRKKLSISLTEREFDELTGLDLNSTRDYYTPPGTEFSGQKWYRDGDDSWHQSPNKPSHQSRFRAPKGSIEVPLSKGTDSPLLKARIPSNISGDVDIKAHLKFWAHSVASTVSAEC